MPSQLLVPWRDARVLFRAPPNCGRYDAAPVVEAGKSRRARHRREGQEVRQPGRDKKGRRRFIACGLFFFSGWTKYAYGFCSGAPVPGEPTNIFRPSPNVMLDPFARKPPSFDSNPFTMIFVPMGTESRSNPRRMSALGAPSSTAQLATLPSGCFTSK